MTPLEICTQVLKSMTAWRIEEPDIEFLEIMLNPIDWETIRTFRDQRYPQAAVDMAPPSIVGLRTRAKSYVPVGSHMILGHIPATAP